MKFVLDIGITYICHHSYICKVLPKILQDPKNTISEKKSRCNVKGFSSQKIQICKINIVKKNSCDGIV